MGNRWAILTGALVLIVGAGAAWIGWPLLTGSAGEEAGRSEATEPADRPAEVEATLARRMDLPLWAEASGHLTPRRKAKISASTGGQVLEVPVEEGARVEEGALLIRLEDREAQIQLKEAKAELLAAQARFASETGLGTPDSTADTSGVPTEEASYLAARKRFRAGSISLDELRAARSELESAGLLAGASQSEVRAARTGLLQAEQQVATARLALERRRIRAPFAGRVANLKAEVGARVPAGETQLTLLADRPMRVRAEVLESDIARIGKGAAAQVRVPALGDTLLTGTVRSVNPLVSPQTGTGQVTVQVPNPKGKLMSGLFAEIRLETRTLPRRVIVPEEAILLRQGRELVFVVENGRAQWTYVQTGPRSGGLAVIREGVTPGDTVATSGHFALAHDARVRAQMVDGPYAALLGDRPEPIPPSGP